MASRLEPIVTKFSRDCNSTLQWLGSTEALWMSSPPTTEVRRGLKRPQLEALYEAAFLRIFTSWEVTLEELTVRMMSRSGTSSWRARPAQGKTLCNSVRDARAVLYGSRDYLLWHNPDTVTKCISKHLLGSPLESEVSAARLFLVDVSGIRHRIAHSSDDSKSKFEAAALSLTGARYGGIPGRLLRAQDISDALNLTRWIVNFQRGFESILQRTLQ